MVKPIITRPATPAVMKNAQTDTRNSPVCMRYTSTVGAMMMPTSSLDSFQATARNHSCPMRAMTSAT